MCQKMRAHCPLFFPTEKVRLDSSSTEREEELPLLERSRVQVLGARPAANRPAS